MASKFEPGTQPNTVADDLNAALPLLSPGRTFGRRPLSHAVYRCGGSTLNADHSPDTHTLNRVAERTKPPAGLNAPLREANAGRRRLLAAGALGLFGLAAWPRTALGSVSFRGRKASPPDRVLVTIFLRGGADGLSLVAPYADDGYYRLRPTIALASPNDGRSSAKERLIDLNGFFGLHPSLAALRPLYAAGQLAFVHSCGSGDETLSHFEAMATMERGLYRDDGPASGWLARHLESAPWESATPLRAVALGCLLPDSLRGATNVTALRSIEDIRLVSAFPDADAAIRERLARLYGTDPHFGASRTARTPPRSASTAMPHGMIEEAGREALTVLREAAGISTNSQAPSNGAVYPKDDLGSGLHQTALLIKSGLGMEAACLDQMGYDTHVAQGASGGQLADCLKSLGVGLAAFAADLGPDRWAKTTVVVLSEFGRRVEENSGAGTDHGHGGVMMVLGGNGIAGGRVHGSWPGLGALDGPGDLRSTTDYRNVLGEILAECIGNPSIGSVFPGLAYRRVGITTNG